MAEESPEELRERVEKHVADMDEQFPPEVILKDFQQVKCAFCGRTCWRSYSGSILSDVQFMRTYAWHRAGWCTTCSLIVCGICSFLEGRKKHSKYDTCPKCGTSMENEKKVPQETLNNSAEPSETTGTSNEKADWSKIIPCHACGAGNPVNATECIRCKKKLSLPEQPDSAERLTLTKEETAKVVSMLNHQFLKAPNIEKQIRLDLSPLKIKQVKNRIGSSIEPETKFWQWLYQHRLFLLAIFLFVSLLAAFIFREHSLGILIAASVIAAFCGFISLIESVDIREGERAERDVEQAKKDMRKKQTHLDMEVERITNVIRKKVEKNKRLENILPKIRSKDYEALAKTISAIDFIKDIDKGCLFKNMNPDFISKVLANFSEADEITILRKIEPEKRKDVLFRCLLSKRNRIESILKQPEVSSQESNDSEGELNAGEN